MVVTSTSGGTAMNAASMPADERHRPLDQPLDLVEQRRIVRQRQPVAAASSAARAAR